MPADADFAARPARWFFALWPGAGELRRLVETRDGLRAGMAGRWVHPADLHVTLAFLGSPAPAQQAAARRIAGDAAGRPFRLNLDHVEFWSRNGIIALVPERTPAALAELAEELAAGLRGAGFRLDRRAYRAHLTLARDGRSERKRVALPEPVVLAPQGFCLAESRSGAAGSAYTVRETWPFAS